MNVKRKTSNEHRKVLFCVLVILLVVIVIEIVLLIARPASRMLSGAQYDALKNSPNYAFTLVENSVPGGEDSFIIDGNLLTVASERHCSAVDCDTDYESKSFRFSDEVMAKVRKFLEEDLKISSENREIQDIDLTSNQREVIIYLSLGEEQKLALSLEKSDYLLEFQDGMGDGHANYSVYFRTDGSIWVSKTIYRRYFNNDQEELYSLDFSNSGKQLLKDYARKEQAGVAKGEWSVIQVQELDEDEREIFESIKNNDETYLR